MRILNKNTWRYRAWRFTHYFWGGMDCIGKYYYLPEQTIVYRYVIRTTLMIIPVCIGFVLLWGAILSIFVIINVFTILSGTGIFLIAEEDDEYDGGRKVIKRFPLVAFGAWQIPLPLIISSLYSLFLIAALVFLYPGTMLTYVGYSVGGLVALALLCVLGAIIIDGFRRVGWWNGWLIFRQYLKDKKQGICQTITFGESDYPI